MHHKFRFHDDIHDHEDGRPTGGRGPFGRSLWGERGERPERPGPGHRGGPFGRGRFFDNGVLRLVVLALIAEQPRHGYEIIKEIEDRTGGAYAPSAGVIYPTLTLLEELGYVTVTAEEGTRKLHTITDQGRAFLEANRPALQALLARMDEASRRQGDGPAPQIVRAMENLKLAMRLRMSRGPLTAEQANAVAAALDAAAQAVERS